MTAWRWIQRDLELVLHVQPKASRDQFVGLHGDALKLAITAPPVDGKANAYIIKLLASWFEVPKASVELVRGELSRHKTVRIAQPTRLPAVLASLGCHFPDNS